MPNRPKISPDMVNRISTINASDLSLLRRLPTIETTDNDFGAVFKQNPAAALAAKGIEITPAEAQRIKDQISGITGATDVGSVATEVEVSVKVKF